MILAVLGYQKDLCRHHRSPAAQDNDIINQGSKLWPTTETYSKGSDLNRHSCAVLLYANHQAAIAAASGGMEQGMGGC